MRRLTVAVVAAAALAGLVACGDREIDADKAEDLARKVAASGSAELEKVSCPSGEKAEKGATFECDLTYADGTAATITLHQIDDDGQVRTSAADIKLKK